MNEHDDMDEIERIARDALHARADQVEPSPDAYARLADKVAGAADRPTPWWQSPRLLWLGAAGATAAVVAIALVATFSGDDGDEVATPGVDTPTPVAEPTTGPTGTPTPEPVLGASAVIWPSTAPGPSWFASPNEAVAGFYRDVLGKEEFSTDDLRLDSPGRISVLHRDRNGALTELVIAEVRLAESAGRWGIISVTSPDVTVDQPSPGDDVVLDDEFVVRGEARDLNGRLSGFVLRSDGSRKLMLSASIAASERSTYEAVAIEGEDDDYAGIGLLVMRSYPFLDQTNPSLHVQQLRSVGADTVTPTPIGGGADRNQGRPDGVVWPVEAIQPFGEWPDSPEAAAQNFVTNVAGWTLPVADVTFLEPIQMIADVTLASTGEDGEPFGAATIVRVVGGFDDNGVPNWGVQSARSERIQVFRVFTLDNEFLVTGDGVGFEGVVEVRLVDANANVAGEGFFTGGAFELAPLEGTVPITENFPGPGFAILFDVGGPGVSPIALSIVPIVLEDLDPPPLGTGPCSAEGLEPPAPDLDLPEQIEATRQAIAAAAIACDWDALGALIDPTNFRYSFGGGNDPITFWQEAEAAIGNEPMRYLVETLKLNWVLDQPPPEAEVPDSYIWPDAFPMIWDDVTPEMREALRPLYDDQDFEGFANIGGFAGYRLAIDEDGNWLYFVAGD